MTLRKRVETPRIDSNSHHFVLYLLAKYKTNTIPAVIHNNLKTLTNRYIPMNIPFKMNNPNNTAMDIKIIFVFDI